MQTVPARSSPTHGLPVALFIIDEGSCSWLAIYTFSDYATRDENTGRIKQGTKAWSIFEACLGVGFHERIKSLDDIVGAQFVSKVEQTKTGSRNKIEFGTAGPVPPRGFGDDEGNAPDFSDLAS
jgi:hypothetical protein